MNKLFVLGGLCGIGIGIGLYAFGNKQYLKYMNEMLAQRAKDNEKLYKCYRDSFYEYLQKTKDLNEKLKEIEEQ